MIISVKAPEDLEDFYKKSIESIKKIEDGAEHKKRIIEEKVKNAIKSITRTSNTIHTVHWWLKEKNIIMLIIKNS